MIQYHVWFDVRPDVDEQRCLKVVSGFLTALCGTQEADSFRLLRNKGRPPRSRLSQFHALIEFRDDTQLGDSMRRQAQRGIHSGLHGEVIEVVSNFHVEIFETLDAPIVKEAIGFQACEI